jgi:cellulose 1,4-beta-cellobiosidase
MKGFIAIAVLCVLLCVADARKIPGHISALANPFMGSDYYVNPSFQQEVQETIDANPQYKPLLSHALNISTAYWIDKIAKISNISVVLDGALAQQKKTGIQTLTAFVIYDLPNRDCAAAASNGEIPCADSTCAAGLNTYKTKYIDPIAAVFTNQPIVLIIEPDSLPNLATNLNVAKCQEAENAYINGVAYAIKEFGMQSNLYMYIDAAHGGWLGWPNNLIAAAQIFLKVLNLAGGPDLIRGFATNTANYQPLGSVTSTVDPCGLKSQYNNAINEVIFVELLSQQLAAVGIVGKGFIIDTSRNGVINERDNCSNWCNIKGSGFGIRPTATPSGLGVSNIDALYWVKTPGESDGSSDKTAPRFDYHCDSSDSQMPAPQAGIWFPSFFINLAQNAVPALM